MYNVQELTEKFNALDSDGKSLVFEQLARNASTYVKIMPDVPLIRYILDGDAGVPINQQGPIINAYKEWIANPRNRAKLRN